MWRRRGKSEDSGDPPSATYLSLRSQVLGLAPETVGIHATPAHPSVWGAVMELGFPEGAATLVGLADGTTSMYTSTGGGVIGGGQHASVTTQTGAFLEAFEAHIGLLGAVEATTAPPTDGIVQFRALTYEGALGASVPEDELGRGDHPLSPIFFAGHNVITALRQIPGAAG